MHYPRGQLDIIDLFLVWLIPILFKAIVLTNHQHVYFILPVFIQSNQFVFMKILELEKLSLLCLPISYSY